MLINLTHYRRVERGFSLIELMIAIGIVAITAVIAVPSFIGTTNRYKAMSEVSGFAGDLGFARSEAIKQGSSVTICVSSDGVTCLAANNWEQGWIMFSDPNANKTVGTIIRRQKSFTTSDTFIADNSASSITYSRDGFTIGLPGTGVVTVTLHTTPTDNQTTQCVAISKTGRHVTQAAGTGACA